MEPHGEPSDDGNTVTAGFKDEAFRLRSYQAEMVEESLKANVIVAMDTGSGKTHIALSRTAAELEACNSDQLVWFLAPTVTLCEQQFKVFQANLPAYGVIVLSGNDNVDHWTDQSIWDSVLSNIRIVLSTHQVLLDALTHAFVRMSRLALLIFDEAHHCISNHPANRIMADFYMPLVQESTVSHLPRILGLSASPVMKASASGADLQKIEQNLNSKAKSPKIHRSELIRFVHRPELLSVSYPPTILKPQQSSLVAALRNAYHGYDLSNDPYVVDLLAQQRLNQDCSKELQKVATTGSTYCKRQLHGIVSKVEAMLDELGESPTEWYLTQCMSKYERTVQNMDQQLLDSSNRERQHLSNIFNRFPKVSSAFSLLEYTSPKVEAFIDILVSEAGPDFTGLVFVEQRVWVAALGEILAIHPRTKDIFNIGTYVGTSNSARRKTNVSDLAEPRNQQNTLDDFRAGKKNLILATSVLEEGIDISSCHLVICFERPKNLKSFVQRRGRARRQESKYIIFMPEANLSARSPKTWESLEDEMKKAYLDDLREVRQAEERELEEEEEESDLYYQVPGTGALLTSNNASQHLHHFCSLLGSGPYVDTRPQFTFDELEDGRIVASVILPISVDPAVRTAQSASSWRTERMAKKDAALQAYKALHVAGLVNDNLLPHRQEQEFDTAEFQIPDYRPGLVEISAVVDPWLDVARQQRINPYAYCRIFLKVISPGEAPLHMFFLTPSSLPQVPEFMLHWNETSVFSVESSRFPDVVLNDRELTIMQSITRKILHSIFHRRMQEERYDFLWLLLPCDFRNPVWDTTNLQEWDTRTSSTRSASDLIEQGKHDVSEWGLISLQDDYRSYMLKGISQEVMDPALTGSLGPQLKVILTPKRRDFLHRVAERTHENAAYTRTEWLNAADCVVNNLPSPYSVLALFFPSILYKHEVYMIAETLRTTILAPLSLEKSHLSLIIRAITSSGTGEEANYQRLEFLGDCILKYIASVHLMTAYITWPESFLSGKKGKVVSNSTLSRATMAAGLDKFIITKRFTGAKWAPRYANDVLDQTSHDNPLSCSTKLLADVVESIIGASYVVGGLPKAFICVQTLLPLEPWTSIPKANETLFEAAPTDFDPTNLDILEQMIGYTFNKKMLLLEAITHASYTGPHANVRSYERLEFLGDAVLDYIVSKRLYNHTPDLSHQKMHSIRTSMVNASFLAFRMFETTVEEQLTNKTTLKPEIAHRALWQFLRHSAHQLAASRDAALEQHSESRDQIISALRYDARFPWHLLSLNDAPKFLSDIVEAVIGAVYVDSHGSFASCEIFVQRLGILDQLERILRDEVDCLHPKERLGHLAVDRSVQYVKIEEGDKGAEGMYMVQVKVGGENVGDPVEGLKRLNAETIAAWKAVKIMEGVDNVVVRDGVGEGDKEDSEDEVWYDAEDGEVLLDGETSF